MAKRKTWMTISLAAGALALGTASWGRQVAVRPNLVLIYADDLGYGDLGAAGHRVLRTPNIDRLASEGLRLTSYYAPSPLCSPSRASLLTGRTHVRTGIETWIPPDADVQLGKNEVTLAKLLKRLGYQTWLAGKWHLNGGLHRTDHLQPDDHGFDHWLALHAWPVPNNRNPRNFYRNGEALGSVEGYSAGIAVNEAIRLLENRDAERPFFLYLATAEPHSPIASPERFNEMYAEWTRGTPEPFDNPDTPGAPPQTGLEARGPGEYYANITYLDHEIGRLLARIDALGLRDDTLVIFASDNGPVTTDWRNWWEINLYGDTGGFRGRKADLYEGGIRVPAIIRWPGRIKAGTVSDVPVIGYDFVPTLASLLDFELPADRPYDGEDVSDLLFGRNFRRSKPLYWQFPDQQGFYYALRDGRWKLLADRSFSDFRLYDLEASRFEVIDLASQEPQVLASLREKLRAIRDDVQRDPLKPR